MQTVATMAERLDMSPEDALEKLKYMLFEIESLEDTLSDEACDVLIDVDDDPDVAERVRTEKLAAQEREKKKKERAAAKRRAAAKKAAATRAKKAAEKKKKEEEEEAKKKEVELLAAQEDAKAAEQEGKAEPTEVEAEPVKAAPVVEILPDSDVPVHEVHRKAEAKNLAEASLQDEAKQEEPDVSIIIGSAIDHEERAVEVVRTDGTHLDVPEVDIEELPKGLEQDDALDADDAAGPAARQSSVIPDPDVVADVIRRDEERKSRKVTKERPAARERAGKPSRGAAAPVPAGPEDTGGRKSRRRSTGKTARKRQKKAERMRMEETLRREAAQAVREYQAGGLPGAAPKRKKRRRKTEDGEIDSDVLDMTIEVEDTMTLEELAELMDVGVNDIILELMDHNIMATKNQALDFDMVKEIAEPKGFTVESVIPEEIDIITEEPDDPSELEPRAPVVTVMGHVDHGKTTFLDRVRSANVADGEAGGITQHIAAYDVPVGEGRVVFLDTPGHEAFTQMRARGAQATDVVVLVVAADDGVMPQTQEAIDHAKAAEVPIVVAVNKCDKPDANPERIRQELANHGLVDDRWGGDTVMRDMSALNGEGVDELMELLVLETELLELKANPNKSARGVTVESEISRGQGAVAWVLVQSGTLRVGDIFLAGESYGRVRSLHNSRGEIVEEAGPAVPVVVTGFSSPPAAGDTFVVVKEERIARLIADKRSTLSKQKAGAVQRVTLEDFHARLLAGEQKELNIIIKADVQGSVDVLESSLSKLGNEEVGVQIVHSGVGGINESDVLLASASQAVVIGFHVAAAPKVQKMAETEGVDIHTYRVIYEAIDEVRRALEGMLTPDTKEVITGHAEIRQVFRSSAIGNIAGCYVLDGTVERGGLARILRDDVIAYDGKVETLRREKDEAKTVASGFECGIKLERFEDIKEGDVIEVYRIEDVAKSLE